MSVSAEPTVEFSSFVPGVNLWKKKLWENVCAVFGVASYAAVFRVAPPLSPHKRLWGERGSETKNRCVGEAMFGVDQFELFYTSHVEF